MLRLLHHACLPLVLLLAAGCLAPRLAQAQFGTGIRCTVTGGYTTANFGGGTTYTGTINYTCTNQSIFGTGGGTFTLCAALGTTRYGSAAQPELEGPRANETLNFNLYTDPAYTAPWTTVNLLQASVTVGGNYGATASGTLYYYGAIAAGQSAAAGTYTDAFTGTVLGYLTGGSCHENNGANQGYSATLNVTDTLAAFCSVSATNVGLGAVADTATNVTGSGTISVNCPSNQAYYIGLAPSNGSTVGAGTMAGSAGNGSQVPYQLYQNAVHTIIWGNTATATQAGNGETGTGNGNTQQYTVYVLVPSANYQADTYIDTVTVTVNY
ncbi:MAG TPA: spore coat U domain-containing protein [Steroidobacteraceae bacterium]|nr:spore coat U domain-containing protein [Steroidobacteraceae bacterium]